MCISCDGIWVPLPLCGKFPSMPIVGVWLPVDCSSVGFGAFCPVESCAHWFCDEVPWTWSRCGTLGMVVFVVSKLSFVCSLWWSSLSGVCLLALEADDTVDCWVECSSIFCCLPSGGFEGLIFFYCWTIVMNVVRLVLLFLWWCWPVTCLKMQKEHFIKLI